MRKRRDREIPVVERERVKRVSRDNQDTSFTVRKKKLQYGLLNYFPSCLIYEDDASTLCHQRRLISEWNKKSPDYRIIDNCMKLTFPIRRTKLITQNLTIKALTDEYPCLMDVQQVRLRVFILFFLVCKP